MRFLLLNQTFHPDVAATAQQASGLAARLVERGHDVTVLCSRRAYDSPGERYPRREIWRGVEIRRISCFGFGKKARWRRAADFASFMANCSRHLAVHRRVDVVVAMTSPPLISWLGALFARVKRCRLVFWIMDLNPDEAVAAGWLRQGSWTTKVLSAMLDYGLNRATTIVALDRFMARRIAAKGIVSTKIVIVPPWSLDAVVRYDLTGRRRFRTQHGLDDKFVVMHSGNHSPCHPLATVLDAARRLQESTDITFCFVGGGSELETVRRFAASHSLSNVRVIPYQPLAQLSASLSAADLHIVVIGDPFVGIVHPSKVYNIRRLGIPFLYLGPTESHISEMKPDFAAAHCDVDMVVRHIRAAAATNVYPMPGHAPRAGVQAQLIARMVSILERAGAPSAARDTETVTV